MYFRVDLISLALIIMNTYRCLLLQDTESGGSPVPRSPQPALRSWIGLADLWTIKIRFVVVGHAMNLS